MPYDLNIPKYFWEIAKNLLDKYPKAKSDIFDLLEFISQHPETGDKIPGYEGKIRKTRGGLKSYNEGKSGGLRIIYYYHGSLLAPLFIYSKRQMADAPKDVIQALIKNLNPPKP
jgi:mRNA-degrading endonuclease RelE of RelBE toxin-antitoxin system